MCMYVNASKCTCVCRPEIDVGVFHYCLPPCLFMCFVFCLLCFSILSFETESHTESRAARWLDRQASEQQGSIYGISLTKPSSPPLHPGPGVTNYAWLLCGWLVPPVLYQLSFLPQPTFWFF